MPFVVLAPEHLGTAKRILYPLAQEPGENHAESLVRAKVCKFHRTLIHGIDEPHPIGEVPFARQKHIDKFRQILRGHGQIGIKDHQDVTRGGTEAFDDSVALAFARLSELNDTSVQEIVRQRCNDVPSIVFRMPLNENQFGFPTKPRDAFNRLRDASGLVASRDDNRDDVGLPAWQARSGERREKSRGRANSRAGRASDLRKC
jgi:hypothetical protein